MITNQIDILFFERPLVDLKRYAFKIAKYLKTIDSTIKLASISIELPDNSINNDIDYYFLRKEIKNIDSFLINHSVKVIVFTNPRIPDMEMILHAHKLGIKTIMIQEGVIFEGANINDVTISNIVSSFNHLKKTLYYFCILFRMCRYDNKSFWSLMKEIVVKKHNITSIVAHFFSPYLIGDYVFTMGEYWFDYYHNVMNYPPNRIKIIGDHDLDGFNAEHSNESAICYISTVLVEDGSRTREEFNMFLDALGNSIETDTKIYLKLHPRSDESLYNKFVSTHNVEIIREGNLPSTTVYIGHRSTLLARALYESDNLIIWKFPNEKEDFFEQFSSFTVNDETQLKTALSKISIDYCNHNKKDIMEKIYWLNPKGAINSAAINIYNYFIMDQID